MADNEVSVRLAGVPSRKYRWVASVLFLTGLFQHLFRLSTFFVVQKVRVWLARLLFFLITYPGIEVTSCLFCSNPVRL